MTHPHIYNTIYNEIYADSIGIKLRAAEGLAGVDYLSKSIPFKTHSTVFGTVITALRDLGYDDTNMMAASVSVKSVSLTGDDGV